METARQPMAFAGAALSVIQSTFQLYTKVLSGQWLFKLMVQYRNTALLLLFQPVDGVSVIVTKRSRRSG